MANEDARCVHVRETKGRMLRTETIEYATHPCTPSSARTHRYQFPNMGFHSARCLWRLEYGSSMFPTSSRRRLTRESLRIVACQPGRFYAAQKASRWDASAGSLRSTFGCAQDVMVHRA